MSFRYVQATYGKHGKRLARGAGPLREDNRAERNTSVHMWAQRDILWISMMPLNHPSESILMPPGLADPVV